MTLTETGPQRAQRRATSKGLTVGAPVRAVIGVGRNRPPLSNERWEARLDGMHRALRESAPPLDVAARLFNYQTQVSVRGHALVGTNWRPTSRQFRRIIKNVSSRATREMLRADRDRRRPRYVPDAAPEPYPVTPESERLAAAWNEPARLGVAPPVMQQNPPERERGAINRNGFRIVDRRGEHR